MRSVTVSRERGEGVLILAHRQGLAWVRELGFWCRDRHQRL